MPSPAPRSAALSFTPRSANSRRLQQGLPADPVDELLALGRKHFAEIEDYPEARAFWWPRFERIARWFANWEIERRADDRKQSMPRSRGQSRHHAEARAASGCAASPTVSNWAATAATPSSITRPARHAPSRRCAPGLAPQLTLEAAILRQGGFPDIPESSSVADVAYVLVKGGEPPGDSKFIDFKDGNADSQADRALAKAHGAGDDVSRTKTRPIARWCIRCGRRSTATTTTSPACWNGPAPARKTTTGAANENGRTISRRSCGNGKPTCPIRTCRPGSPPMPAPARPTCWRSGSSTCCSRASTPEKILCITFTKAAAANMAKRVFDTLGKWTKLDDDGAGQGDHRLRHRDQRGDAHAGAAAVRARAGNAGRPESPDHPRLLHPAAASVSVRGQCRGALCRARRCRADAAARIAHARRAVAGRRSAGEPARPCACGGDDRRRRPDVPRSRPRRDRARRYDPALDRQTRRQGRGAGRALHRARRRSGDDADASRAGDRQRSDPAAVGMASGRRDLSGQARRATRNKASA